MADNTAIAWTDSTFFQDWHLLTKRALNITKFLPADWGNGYPNVWLGATVKEWPRAA